ncbi:MAG: cell division protein ZapE [Methylococcales bacterium]|nr:cell division protein ZapE [Methylococcales bacterium]
MFKKLLSRHGASRPIALRDIYQQQIDQGQILYDDAQAHTLPYLQALLDDLPRSKARFWQRLQTQRRQVLGVYLYGEVGRGKSMLMDLFWQQCPVREKRRVHFHTFMLEVHDYMHRHRKGPIQDPIAHFAEHIHHQTQVLCFDEFHVIDIANAMILKRLFTRLLALGTLVVTTSNRPPDTLYQGGYHPELFQPFIDFLKNHLQVVELRGQHDYRHQPASHDTHWLHPNTPANHARLLEHYRTLCQQVSTDTQAVRGIYGRKLPLAAHHGRIALAEFNALCGQALGPADYQTLAQHYDVLVLSHVPRFGPDNHDAGKRFSTLIDALYFYRKQLMVCADTAIDSLCLPGENAFYLKRMLSRLREMQSPAYHRG